MLFAGHEVHNLNWETCARGPLGLQLKTEGNVFPNNMDYPRPAATTFVLNFNQSNCSDTVYIIIACLCVECLHFTLFYVVTKSLKSC